MNPTAHERTILETLIAVCADALKPSCACRDRAACPKCGGRKWHSCKDSVAEFCPQCFFWRTKPAPQPGPLVSGGPVPKPGEISEGAMLRLDLRELKTELREAKAEIAELDRTTNNLIDSGSTQQDQIEKLQMERTTDKDRLWIVVNGLIESFEGHTATIEHLQMDLLALLRPPVIDGTENRALGAHIAEIKDWIADHDAGRQYPSVLMPIMEGDGAKCVAQEAEAAPPAQEEAAPKKMFVREACRVRTPLDGADAQALEHALTQTESEVCKLRAALKAEEAAHAETKAENDRLTKGAYHLAEVAVGRWTVENHEAAVAQARAEAIEECARAAESAEDPVSVFLLHDGRVTVLG